MNKSVWASKTMWTNIVAAMLLVVLPMVGIDPTPEVVHEYGVHLLVVVNLVLRMVTDTKLVWK